MHDLLTPWMHMRQATTPTASTWRANTHTSYTSTKTKRQATRHSAVPGVTGVSTHLTAGVSTHLTAALPCVLCCKAAAAQAALPALTVTEGIRNGCKHTSACDLCVRVK